MHTPLRPDLARVAAALAIASTACATSACRRSAPEPAPETPEAAAEPTAPAAEDGERGDSFAAYRSSTGALGAVTVDLETPPGPLSPASWNTATVTGDWTMLRGEPGRSGIRDTRGIAAPKILWSAEVGIQGYANTPLVVGDTVYVSSQGLEHNEVDARDGVVALARTTGRLRWRVPTSSDANGMVYHDGALYVGTDSGLLYSIDATSGETRWTADVGCPLRGAPLVQDGRVYIIRAFGRLASFDAATGATDSALPQCFPAERGSISTADGAMYLTPALGAHARYDDADEALWRGIAPERGTNYGAWQPPLLTEQLVIASYHHWPVHSDETGANGFRPHAIARWRANGDLAFVFDPHNPRHIVGAIDETARDPYLRSMPLIHSGRLLWSSNFTDQLLVWDLASGDRARPRHFDDCRSRQFASPVATLDTIYWPRHDGMLYGLRADLSEAWRISLGEHGSAGNAATHDPAPDRCTENPTDSTALFSTPAIGEDGVVYVGSGDGWLYAIADRAW